MQKSLVHWSVLLALTALFISVSQVLHLPAAFLLGPLAAAVLMSTAGAAIRLPAALLIGAQALIGCMIARALQLPVLIELLRDWPLFLGVITTVLLVSTTLSWFLMRWRVLPGTTAIWGSFPGAALVMCLMAQSYGEDVRLVAFMQYLRLVCVAIAAPLVARIWTGSAALPAVDYFPPIAAAPFLMTVGIACAGAWLGVKLRLPAGAGLAPMIACTVLQDTGLLTLVLPPWLLAAGYAFVGWSIGARLTRDIVRHALRALPRVLAAILVLIALCARIGHALSRIAGLDEFDRLSRHRSGRGGLGGSLPRAAM